MEFTRDYFELIFGLTAPIGVSLEKTIEVLKDNISQHNYNVQVISTINLAFNKNDTLDKYRDDPGWTSVLVKRRQSSFEHETQEDLSYIGSLAIDKVRELREKNKNHCSQNGLYGTVFIFCPINDLKDFKMIKSVFGGSYYQFGITDSQKSRKENLNFLLKRASYVDDKSKTLSHAVLENIEKNELSKVFVKSDFFINLGSKEGGITSIPRFVDLIFGAPNISPYADEYSMFMAFMASISSADLSRQVGAVITNQTNEIVATGNNDVQKSGGGKYWPDETYTPLTSKTIGTYEDKRDAMLGSDANHDSINELSLDIARTIISHLTPAGYDDEKLATLLRDKTRLSDLTEFGRIVHAEMSALMSALRSGRDITNHTLYCTTFPCHNCAKHIVASGIKEVFFIEPYPKSKALILHSDSISLYEDSKKTRFRAFNGVGPYRFLDFFSMMGLGAGKETPRKDKETGLAKLTKRGSYSSPRVPIYIEQVELFMQQEFVLNGISEAKKIKSKKDPWFENEYSSYIKLIKREGGLSMIKSLSFFEEDYPFDYGFNFIKMVPENYKPFFVEGLKIKFKINPGNNHFWLACDIEPTVNLGVTKGGDILHGEFVRPIRKTNGQWWIDKLDSVHTSDYEVKSKNCVNYTPTETGEMVEFKLYSNHKKSYFYVDEVKRHVPLSNFDFKG